MLRRAGFVRARLLGRTGYCTSRFTEGRYVVAVRQSSPKASRAVSRSSRHAAQ